MKEYIRYRSVREYLVFSFFAVPYATVGLIHLWDINHWEKTNRNASSEENIIPHDLQRVWISYYSLI